MTHIKSLARFCTIAIPLVWLGMVVAISFVEAPLKFTAPGVTVEVGVSIGRIVFGALNKIEGVLFTLWLIAILAFNPKAVSFVGLLMIISILALQTFWLLPALDERVDMLLEGASLPASPLHTYFIVGEIIKIVCLAFTSFKTVTKITYQINHLNKFQI